MTSRQESIALPPELAAALPPGEPGTKAPPTVKSLPGLRKRFLEEIGDHHISASLPEPMYLKPPETRAWIESVMDAADTRMLGLLIARVRQYAHWNDTANEGLVHWLTLQHGLGVAFDALLCAERWRESRDANSPGLCLDWPVPDSLGACGTKSLWAFRSHWVRAPQAERSACMDRLHALGAQLPLHSRARFAIVLPEARSLAAQLWSDATPELRETSWAWVRWAAGCPLDDIQPEVISTRGEPNLYAVLIREYGLQLLPRFLSTASRYANADLAWYLAAYDTSEATLALVHQASKEARCAEALAWVCTQRPERALEPLAQVLGEGKLPKGGAARLIPNLKAVAALLGERLSERMGALSPVAREVLAPFANQSAVANDTFAPRDQWPAVLADPPWTRASPKGQKVATLTGLPMLALEPTLHWDAGQRAAALKRHAPRRGSLDALERALPTWAVPALLALAEDPVAIEKLIADWNRLHADDRAARYPRLAWAAVKGGWGLPDAAALAFWNAIGSHYPEPLALGYLARFGVAAAPGLLNALRNGQDEHDATQHIGATEIAPFMAQMLARKPSKRAVASRWLLRFPEHAAAGLLPAALGAKGESQTHARAALRTLILAGHGETIAAIARRYADPKVLGATNALLAEDPLHEYPSRITARSQLPDFWLPAGKSRPRLAASHLPLPDEALYPLGLMLSFAADRAEGYAGLDAVKAVCTPQSLADFAWEMCEAWEAAGCNKADSWALRVLGLVGTDDTARKLAAMARRWSLSRTGGTATRIAWVLETLARWGSDVALMQLDALARTCRVPAVREQAALRLAEAAEARGLSPEQLQDRVVPDLGLDARGSMLLDFGARQFAVDFDEALKPQVRELVNGRLGPRLASAPRPRDSDDAARAADAIARFKALKQDAETIAAQQPARLERAMCEGRRWAPGEFRQFLAGHPLMRHLVQRLVWGVVAPDAASGSAAVLPALAAVFRVSADGEWISADDAPWSAPSGWPAELPADGNSEADAQWSVVLAHPLQLSAPQIAAFSQQLSDYELIQPFEQLQRAVYWLTEAEQTQRVLTRWVGQTASPGALWGLEARGWLRSWSEGGDMYTQAVRTLPTGGSLILSFYPGLARSDRETAQTLGELQHGAPLADLSPIAFSEAVRDLQSVVR